MLFIDRLGTLPVGLGTPSRMGALGRTNPRNRRNGNLFGKPRVRRWQRSSTVLPKLEYRKPEPENRTIRPSRRGFTNLAAGVAPEKKDLCFRIRYQGKKTISTLLG